MNPEDTQVLEWLREQLAKFEKALDARKQEAKAWSEGTDKEWRAVGCKLSKSERLKLSASHFRIVIKCIREVEMCKAAITVIQKYAP